MFETSKRTRRYVLAERPATPTGTLQEGVLRYEEDVPVPRLEAGQVLVKVEWMSLDPATRGWMNDTPNYIPPSPLGETMRALGAGTVSASEHPDFTVGDSVCGLLGWQEDAVVDGSILRRVPEGVPLNASLNVLGIAGQTAWLGMHDIGQPKKGETVVVTAAAGSVGSVAVQLAIAAGARVIGVAGTPAKCEWVRDLGAGECADYRKEDAAAACSRLCPDGIDVAFDNVGGEMLDSLLPHLARFDEIEADLLPRLRRGELRSREHVVEGLTAAPAALHTLFDGTNTGKLLVRVGHS